MDYIKSPLNYTGGKYKLLPQIIPKFPNKINTFVDVFGGGFNVGINTNSDKIIYNDIITPLSNLILAFKENNINDILEYIDSTIKDFNLSKTNKEAFNNFRDYYNYESNNALDLYVLICFSFNHGIRFNSEGLFNYPSGFNRSHYTKNMKNNLIKFKDKIDSMNITVLNKAFDELNYNSDSFYYFDPPYLLTDASYGGNWREKSENKLLNILSQNNFKFALSNVIEYDGKTNDLLKQTISKNNWNVIPIESDYSNSSYQKKKRVKNNEVLITNYEKPTIQKGLNEWM
jgi:DNA adenine methylase Dam